MKRHIKYIVYEISPCRLGNLHRTVLEFYNEMNAIEFITIWQTKYDFNFVCLKLMKVLV